MQIGRNSSRWDQTNRRRRGSEGDREFLGQRSSDHPEKKGVVVDAKDGKCH